MCFLSAGVTQSGDGFANSRRTLMERAAAARRRHWVDRRCRRRDCWLYLVQQWLRQQQRDGATGSSLASSYDSEPGKTSADGPRKVIENPTIADLAVPGPLGDRFIGRADAPVTVVEYASLTCPYCRKFHAEEFAAIKKKYIDSGKVRWVLREFPIGHSSGNAWVVNRCAAADKYFDLFAAYLAEQPSWVSLEVRLDQIHAVAAKFGMTRETFNKCLEDKSLIDGLKWVKARGRELGVTGTPTFFVGDKKLRSVMTLKEFEAAGRAATGQPASRFRTVRPRLQRLNRRRLQETTSGAVRRPTR